ncbi:MAG: helix-turn-helix transcriptional regulator [Spirochaetes bacterium]|nr:helix-turn-helix transcriptional regulator [Spirochaetota bacterium]
MDVLLLRAPDDATVWLRARFELDNVPGAEFGVVVMGRDRNVKLFINGASLEKTGDLRITNIYSPVYYTIPNALLRKGTNVIHVRASVSGEYVPVANNISIVDAEGQARGKIMHELVFTQLPLAILIFNFSLLFPPMIFFIWNRWARVLAYGSLVLLLFILYILFEFIPLRYAGEVAPMAHLALIPVFGVLLFVAVQSLYRIYMSFFIRLTTAACFVTSLLILVVDRRIVGIYSPFVLLAGIIIIVPLSIWILNMINSIKKDRLQFFMLVALILAAGLVGVYEVVAFVGNLPYAFLGPIYCSPIFVIIFMVLASRELMRNTVRMELLYKTLGKPERKDNGPIITDMTESKLKSVIDFINQNYAQDISREGLAGAIDISTDYMSRLFKKYTGKKINEYINELRIRDAMRKLDDKNVKIIDIALSVGFESLSTFNRAFKQVTGITPSSYRGRDQEA